MERNQLSFTPGDTRRIQASFGHWCISPVCYKIGIFTDRFATLTKKHNSAGGAELLLNPVHKFSTILILNRPYLIDFPQALELKRAVLLHFPLMEERYDCIPATTHAISSSAVLPRSP